MYEENTTPNIRTILAAKVESQNFRKDKIAEGKLNWCHA